VILRGRANKMPSSRLSRALRCKSRASRHIEAGALDRLEPATSSILRKPPQYVDLGHDRLTGPEADAGALIKRERHRTRSTSFASPSRATKRRPIIARNGCLRSRTDVASLSHSARHDHPDVAARRYWSVIGRARSHPSLQRPRILGSPLHGAGDLHPEASPPSAIALVTVRLTGPVYGVP